jgi:cell fate regulator YaaT (PSP1 superfamily)
MTDFELNGAQRGLCAKGCGRQDKQLNTYDYLADVPGNREMSDLVEVQFKNTRKDYYLNSNHLPLEKGDMVAVESSPGHDIGVVTLTGSLVPLQMKKQRLKSDAGTKRVYRIARDIDIQKYEEAKTHEYDTMIKSRRIAKDLGLDMKIGDVEYQGDGNKAIFYYIADQRVDFRKLIKVLAEEFHVRIEMKQIGARQEAGRIGGIGPCGREMCCATWMKNFVTVSTGAARCQDVSLNPQKLAGQCAKLKCCLNYEVSAYTEAAAKLPPRDVTLETEQATYYFFKSDILAGLISYSTDKHLATNVETITAERAREVAEMNKKGQKPATLKEEAALSVPKPNIDLAAQESLTRFDKHKKKKNKNRGRRGDEQGERRQEKDQQRKSGAEANGKAEPPAAKAAAQGQEKNKGQRNQRPQRKARRPEQPRNDGQQPRKEGQQPRKEGQQPRKEGQQPKKEGQQPRKEGQQPRKEGQQPKTEGQQPKKEPRQPRPEKPSQNSEN